MTSVRDAFTESFLFAEAGEGAFTRGAGYEREARVGIVSDVDGRAEAIVDGSERYAVALWIEHDRPGSFCACPAALDGSLCKHAVATALALAKHQVRQPLAPFAPHAQGPTPPSRAPLPPADAREWGKRVTKAFAAGGSFVDYRHAPHWAAGVQDMLDEVQRLLDAGHGDVVLILTEQAHKRAETALGRIDDSDGWLTDISRRIADLHQTAATRVRPPPRSFAKRLFDLETNSHTLDTFHRAAATYADVLGPDGLARYRQLTDDAWAAADHRGERLDTFRLEQARIGVAIGGGDPDSLIAVKRNDLRSPYDHLEIVEMLAAAGRTDEAVDWARRGLDQFADRWYQTPKLRDADHPLDAIVVYERNVEQHIDRKNKTGYRAAVRQLGHIRRLATVADRPEVFEDLLERIRTEHRLKRTLMGFVDAAKFG